MIIGSQAFTIKTPSSKGKAEKSVTFSSEEVFCVSVKPKSRRIFMLTTVEAPRYPTFQEVQPRNETLIVNAFLQLFVKKGEHVGCLTYPVLCLPGVRDARNAVISILYPDRVAKDGFYQSPNGDLQFVIKQGIDAAAISRFFSIPAQMWEIGQRNKTQEFTALVGEEFFGCVSGKNHQSGWASRGKQVFAFSYRQKGDGLYGIAGDGREMRLSSLAARGYSEHARMLSKLEEVLVGMDEGMAIHIAFDGTVDPCCGNFFRTKMGGEDGDDKNEFSHGYVSSYFFVYRGSVRLEATTRRWCNTCKKFYVDGERHECKNGGITIKIKP